MVLKLLGSLVDPTDRYSSTSHRIFAKVLVVLIKLIVGSVTPLSFLLFSYLLFNYQIFRILNLPAWAWNSSQWTLVGLSIWSLAEVGFYLHCLNLKRQFSMNSAWSKLVWSERRFYLQRLLDHNPTPFKSLVKWFHKNEPGQVTVENVEDWLAWAFFSKLRVELNAEELGELSDIVDMCLEKDPSLVRTGDYSKQLEFMKLHLDPIKFQHKPMIAYLVIMAMQYYGKIFLTFTGFKHHYCQPRSTLSYWIYNGKNTTAGANNNFSPNKDIVSTSSTKPPVFLIYGIGIGVTMYLKVINAIRNKDPSRTIVVLELPHISLQLVHHIPSMDATLEAIDNILKKHDLPNCNWLGHSYGSIVTAWVIKNRPKYVLKVTLVDPVCFALWEPDLTRNFLYNSHPIGPIHHLAQFFVAKDLLVASTLFRNFWWLQNILFPDDLTCPTHVYFSRYDWIIDAAEIHRYLLRFCEQHPWADLKTEMMEDVAHGGFISSDEKIKKVLKYV